MLMIIKHFLWLSKADEMHLLLNNRFVVEKPMYCHLVSWFNYFRAWVHSLALSKETVSEVVKLVYNDLYIIICLKLVIKFCGNYGY